MAQELVVLSPEKAIITYRIASIGSRISAHIVDALLIAILIFLLIFVGGLLAISSALLAGPLMVLLVATPFLYFILFEGLWNGQTLGKRWASISVRMSDGTPVTFGAALCRNLLRVADLFPATYLVGFLAIFTNNQSQRLGDMVADTVVITLRPVVPLFSVAPYKAGVHQFEDFVGDVAGLRIEEYLALKQLCDRFPLLTVPMQDKLLREVWTPLAAKYGIAEPEHIHPIYLAEATVMKYGRANKLL